MVGQRGEPAADKGNCDAELAAAATRIDARYELPYLAHAPMEPLNATVRIAADGCEIWTGTQSQTGDQKAAAEILGIAPEKVALHTTFLGGGFGRRAALGNDFVREAVQVARAAGAPVKTVWTRDDDVRGGRYRPMFVHRVEAGLDVPSRAAMGGGGEPGTPPIAPAVANAVFAATGQRLRALPFGLDR